jgi:hypothetical protein
VRNPTEGRCFFCQRPGRPLARRGDEVLDVCRAHHRFLCEDPHAPVVGRRRASGVPPEFMLGLGLVEEVADEYAAPGELEPALEPRPITAYAPETPLCLARGD